MTIGAAELDASVGDIIYEIRTLLAASVCCDQAKRKLNRDLDPEEREGAENLNNFALESFLLHYRNLDEFLHNMGMRDSVNAKDYAANWIYKRKTKTKPNAKHHPKLASQDEIDRVHKRLAHISTERRQREKNWDIRQMQQAVCLVFEEFVRSVPEPYKTKFQRATAGIQHYKKCLVEEAIPVAANSTISSAPPFHWINYTKFLPELE